ncbi:MAG: zinc transport system permease protein [Parasphingorhabdus sp.]|jgi:zinc transport system permease protein
MDDFLLRALIAGGSLAVVCGFLGVFVVWRRMAYFGDTVAHSALLGVALGYLLQINTTVAVLLVACSIALLLSLLGRQQSWSSDTLLGMLSHSSLALGLITLSLMSVVPVSLMGFLFGDILAVNGADILWITSGCGLVLVLLIPMWKPLIALSVHRELAAVEGAPVIILELAMTLMVAIVIALAMKIVGILLITALLIIPAAAASRFSRTPFQMGFISAIIGVLSVAGGLTLSWFQDTPAGASIVLMAFAIFLLGMATPSRN